jgi:hypothetical protein
VVFGTLMTGMFVLGSGVPARATTTAQAATMQAVPRLSAPMAGALGHDPIETDGTDWNSISPEAYGYNDDWTTPRKGATRYTAPSILSFGPQAMPGPWRNGYTHPAP